MTDESDATKEQLPTPASTVVLMRPADGVPFEVFLVRRHRKSRFMANAYVYPGGQLDESDTEETLAKHCRGILPEVLSDRMNLEATDARGMCIAAMRETFEEAGALLLTEADGTEIDLTNPDELDRYETYREALLDGEVTFDQIIGWEDLAIELDRLTYFAHWITPEIEPHRYDTRFFLARAPRGQRLGHDATETTDSLWITPAEAVRRYYDEGTIQLAPPTLLTLRKLSEFHSIDDALDYYRDRPVPTILPVAIARNGDLVLLLPGDAEYPLPPEPGVEGPTRILLVDGLWRPVEPEPEREGDESEVSDEGEEAEGSDDAEDDDSDDSDGGPQQFTV